MRWYIGDVPQTGVIGTSRYYFAAVPQTLSSGTSSHAPILEVRENTFSVVASLGEVKLSANRLLLHMESYGYN